MRRLFARFQSWLSHKPLPLSAVDPVMADIERKIAQAKAAHQPVAYLYQARQRRLHWLLSGAAR